MNLYIFLSHINIFKILLKCSHNIEFVLSSSIFLSQKSAIFNPFDLARFPDLLQNENVMWQCEHDTSNRFIYLPKRQKIPMLWATETSNFIRIIARVFIQPKQPYLWFIAHNDRNMSWGHNADNYFLNLNSNIHTYHLHSRTSTNSS